MGQTAIVIGATGLIGKELVTQLLSDAGFSTVKVFVRKKLELQHQKLEQVITDFDKISASSEKITGDVVFCAMGTTIRVAGSQEAFVKVDHTYVLNFAEAAKKNGVTRFVLVSSLGVSESGGNFYLTVKRDIEHALKRLKFASLIIVRPSMLLGQRAEFRLGESIGKFLMKALGFLFIGKLKKYKAIEAAVVAKAMIALSKVNLEDVSVFESDRLQVLGK
ncbi:MAG: oxidoreductase [Bacteroidetes bacterium]|nr:oxidoreductase [Bacteroidota bacterium]